MYKEVVQAVLLYGRKIWLVTDVMMTVIEGFRHRIDIQIAGITARKGDGMEWEWALVDAALETTGFWPMREYVRRWQADIAEYIEERPI